MVQGAHYTERVGTEVDNQVAAPAETRTPTWHRANIAHKECAWKDGDIRRLGGIGTDSQNEESESVP
jgi:hypothetical protein